MHELKAGQKVTASTTSGTRRDGVYVATHPSKKGVWIEVKPDDGTPNYKTRASLVTPAKH
jgi:nitrogen fixation protein FixH